ncbi:MAG: DUF1311 domain-containing protein [Lachnospiraceae bacterium]|nr:DUF1311 domain-containing protein [Lachnospiraceae bacterium]
MKKRIMIALMMGLIVMVTGCSKDAETTSDTTDNTEVVETEDESTSEEINEATDASAETEVTSEEEEAAWMDYSNTIATEVETITSSATTVQDEMSQVETLVEKYDALTDADISQIAMNQASQWPATVWDTELNSLWTRMSESLDDTTKESVETGLTQWKAMKEDAIVCAIGSEKDGGSIYGMSYQQQLADMTRRKVYSLANIYATSKGEEFTMPEASVYAIYVNTEDTSEIYDSLAITESYEGSAVANISLYRTTTLTGSVTENGDGLSFVSEEGDVEGTITYGWEGATLTIDKSGNSLVEAGQSYSFPLVF